MSTYYSFYIGYKHEGKIYPLGPYNHAGKIRPAISRSGGFVSSLNREFNAIPDDMISEPLRKTFEYESWNGEMVCNPLQWLPMADLLTESSIKSGYFLIRDVEQYLQHPEYVDELFYEHLSPEAYAAKAANEARFGKPAQPADEDEGPVYSAADYMYYAYQDTHCPEYEAEILRWFADSFEYDRDIPEQAKRVIILEIS